MFALLASRLFVVEVINGADMQARALDQWTRDVPVTAERGNIYDTNGVILADTETTYTVFVRPNSVKDKDGTARVLSEVLGLNYALVREKVGSKVSEYTAAKQITKGVMQEIINRGVSGVYFSQNIKRVYPYGDFMTQILGFTNIDGDGQSGVEAYYNHYLSGINGYILTETDLVGRELYDNVTRYIPAEKGSSVYLTIDYYIQSFVENAVNKAYAAYNAKAVSCLMMNARTGAVVGMAQRPSYDLNNVPRDDIAKLFAESKSTLISNVYEPGSTFKIITTAIGLDKGFINRNYNLHCPGYRMVDGKKIRCWRTTGHGSETFDEGVYNSCNCLFMDIALRVGANNFYGALSDYGVLTKTGIDMSGEASALTIALDSVKTVDLARIGFGQAIAVTGIELAAACAAIINGGTKITPHIIDKVETNDKKLSFSYAPKTGSRIISTETSKAMVEILTGVVEKGSGKNAKVAGFSIGGKTGTAQKYVNGQIAPGKYVSTFLGFTTIDGEPYIALFTVDEPQGYLYYGSIVAAPYVGEIFKNTFEYKGMKPAGTVEKPRFLMPDLMGMSVAEAESILKKNKLIYELDGESGTVKYQFPAAGSYVTTDNIALISIG